MNPCEHCRVARSVGLWQGTPSCAMCAVTLGGFGELTSEPARLFLEAVVTDTPGERTATIGEAVAAIRRWVGPRRQEAYDAWANALIELAMAYAGEYALRTQMTLHSHVVNADKVVRSLSLLVDMQLEVEAPFAAAADDGLSHDFVAQTMYGLVAGTGLHRGLGLFKAIMRPSTGPHSGLQLPGMTINEALKALTPATAAGAASAVCGLADSDRFGFPSPETAEAALADEADVRAALPIGAATQSRLDAMKKLYQSATKTRGGKGKGKKEKTADEQAAVGVLEQMSAIVRQTQATGGAKEVPAQYASKQLDPRLQKIVRASLRRGFHLALLSTHVAADATLDTAALGMPADKIADILFAALDAALFTFAAGRDVVGVLTSFAGAEWSDYLLGSFGRGGPAAVAGAVDEMLVAVANTGGSAASDVFFQRMSNLYASIIDWGAPLFASIVQLAIPSDWGSAKAIVEGFLVVATQIVRDKPFTLTQLLFSRLPLAVRQLLVDKKKMAAFFMKICEFLEKLFPPKGASRRVRVEAALKRTATAELFLGGMGLLIGPGTGLIVVSAVAVGAGGFLSAESAAAYMREKIQDTLEPNVEKMAERVQQCMSLIFATLYMIELKSGSRPEKPPPVPSREGDDSSDTSEAAPPVPVRQQWRAI